MKFKKILIPALTILVIFLVFRFWFFNSEIIGSDFPYIYPETVNFVGITPPPWSAFHGNGLGDKILVYSLDSYFFLTLNIAKFLNIEWPIIYKIFWYGLFVFLSFLSSYYLSKKILGKKPSLNFISSLVYSTNTYILMIVGGGANGPCFGLCSSAFAAGAFA